jgi:undecaprenyl-diphosphatase
VKYATAAGLLALHVVLGLVVTGERALGIDRTAFDAVAEIRFGGGVDVMKVLTDVASLPATAVVVAVTALLVGARGRRDQAIGLVAGLIVVFVSVRYAKELWDRPRPDNRLSGVFGRSYPSGHAAYATAFLACAMTTRERALIAAAAAWIMVVAVTRLYLHVHYLTDVVGGAALGLAVFALVLRR